MFRISLISSLLTLLVLSGGLMVEGCGRRHPAPNRLVLVTIDTLRADHVGVYGYPLQTTPFIDSLAAKGVVFRHAFAHASMTGPSHASIFTGLYPLQHGVEANGQKLDESLFTLAEAMSESGFRTAAFVSTNAHFKWADLSQGFEKYDEQPIREKTVAEKPRRQYRSARETIDSALDWLAEIRADEPLFLWVHLYDPHRGLRPPEIHLTEIRNEVERLGARKHQSYLEAAHGSPRGQLYEKIQRYDAEILFADRELGRLYRALSQAESQDLWIVTSDHGQGLNSHDRWFGHTRQIYNTQVRVPLIFHMADGSLLPGVIDDVVVEQIDLVHTLAEIFGFEFSQPWGEMLGSSWVPLLKGQRPDRWKSFSFSQGAKYKKGRKENRLKPKYSLQSLQFKYILNEEGGDEFYRLESDPHERTNRIEDSATRAESTRMREFLENMIKTLPKSDLQVDSVDAETLERLKTLGYLQ